MTKQQQELASKKNKLEKRIRLLQNEISSLREEKKRVAERLGLHRDKSQIEQNNEKDSHLVKDLSKSALLTLVLLTALILLSRWNTQIVNYLPF